MRIGARQVAFDDSEFTLVLEHDRQMAAVKPSGPGRDQCRKRALAHQRVHLRQIGDAKMIGLVHDNHREQEPSVEKTELFAQGKWTDNDVRENWRFTKRLTGSRASIRLFVVCCRCPLWVIGDRIATSVLCPLYRL